MKKSTGGMKVLSLVLICVIILSFFPIGVIGEVGYNRNVTVGDNRIKTSFKLTGNDLSTGTLVPVITFSEAVVYNGRSQNLAEVNPIVDGPELDSELIEITYQGTKLNGDTYPKSLIPPTDTGTYTVVAGYQGDKAYKAYAETKTITISPLELKTTDFFTTKPISKIYDGTVNAPDNIITGLNNTGVLETDLKDVKFNYKSASYLSKDVNLTGINAVILKEVTITGDKGTEYSIVDDEDKDGDGEEKPSKNIDISLVANINPKMIEVILVGQNKVYDGSAILNDYKLLVRQADLIKGDEVAVSGSEQFYPWYGTINTKQKDIGNYYVWAIGGFSLQGLNGTNSNDYMINNFSLVSKLKYAITPASVTVIPSYITKVEGTPDPVLTYAVWQDESGDGFVKGLYGNDVLSGSLTRESGEAIGTYDIYLGSLNNPNYKLSLADGKDKFEITKGKEVAATYVGNDADNNTTTGSGEIAEEKKSPVPYLGIAMLLILLIAVGVFFGKNRLTKMD
ncbi:MBG domain-containing protein [Acetobacterium woodii]|uniref:MBG domain-containing protein n=1 Tax=Acetobacterium woodii (strain ATCC 29683 / DSM 1030 / JCM 2381 / KCTC 1655 / WB1) TaxID=931626 RepID=H6LH01_ACEWD|nr:MBG domain-containing protein [Acetobacterium woodii]AFA47139.1 hypothetical protein Awo_c03350 [Acetobacterium woodii DSM 1030]